MKIKIANFFFFLVAAYMNHPEKLWNFFLNFDQKLAIENPKKQLILALLVFKYSFLAKYSQL